MRRSFKALFLAGAILIANDPAAMASTFDDRELTCPYDGTKFKAVLQGSGTSFGSMLDGRPFGPIVSPWPLAICPTNGFVFFKNSFTDDELERLRPLVLSEAFQSLRAETPYYRVAWLKERLGMPRSEVSWTLLQATWETRDAGTYRRYADELLQRLPIDIWAEKDPDKAGELRVLVVELLRRTGQLAAAAASVSSALADIEAGTSPHLIAQFQRELIEKRDTAPKQIPGTVGQLAKPSSHWMAQRLPRTDASRAVIGDLLVQFPARVFLWSKDSGAVATRRRDSILSYGVDGRPNLQVAASGSFGSLLAALPSGGWLATSRINVSSISTKHLIAQLDESMNTVIEMEVGNQIFDVNTPTITNDGRAVIVYHRQTVAYDLAENRLATIPWPEGSFYIVASDQNRPRMLLRAHADYSSLMLWDYAENKAIWALSLTDGTRRLPVTSAAFSPDGTRVYVAAGSQNDCETIAMDAGDGSVLAKRQAHGRGSSVSVGNAGRLIAASCGPTLSILDQDLAEVGRIEAPNTFTFGHVAFSPDGRKIAMQMGDVVSVFAVRQDAVSPSVEEGPRRSPSP